MAAHERRHTGEKPYPCPYVLIFVRVDVGGVPVILPQQRRVRVRGQRGLRCCECGGLR
jgi:hypothetical protein